MGTDCDHLDEKPRALVLLFNDPSDGAIAPLGQCHVSTNRTWGKSPFGVIWTDLGNSSNHRTVIGYPPHTTLGALLLVATFGHASELHTLLWVSDQIKPGWSVDVVHDRTSLEVCNDDDRVLRQNTLPYELANTYHPWSTVNPVYDRSSPNEFNHHYQQWIARILTDRSSC